MISNRIPLDKLIVATDSIGVQLIESSDTLPDGATKMSVMGLGQSLIRSGDKYKELQAAGVKEIKVTSL